jgi:hypothetical protein
MSSAVKYIFYKLSPKKKQSDCIFPYTTIPCIIMKSAITDTLLQAMRQQTDPAADEVIGKIFAEGKAGAVNQLMAAISKNHSELSAELPGPVLTFFSQTAALPAWADTRKMQEGARFFARHVQPILSILGSLSLPYCYAAADGAQVLYLSQRIRNDTRKRLADTGQFVLTITARDAFSQKGNGIRTIQKVRLMHAAVRFHVWQSRQWNNTWGKPVNQEDMAGTNLAFSYIVLEGLQKLGVYYSPQEAEAYLHLLNVNGYLLGVDEKLLPSSMKEAYDLCRIIEKRHFRKSEAGIELTKALLTCFDEMSPSPALKAFHPSYMRFLLGNKVADLLEVPDSNATQLLLTPVKAVNYVRSIAGSFSGKTYTQASNLMLQLIEGEHGKADFKIPASLT